VPVILTWSWAVVAVLLAYLYWSGFSQAMPADRQSTAFAMALALVLLLFVSVFIHELAHGLAGKAFGQRPKEYVLTFWGGHTTFSAAGATPLNRAVTSFAGPAANLVLAGVCWLVGRFLTQGDFGYLGMFGGSGGLSRGAGLGLLVIYYAGLSNWLLGLFNLIPAAPLDGGGLVEALVWKLSGRRTTGMIAAGWCGLVAALGLVAWALWQQAGGTSLDAVLWRIIIGVIVGQGAYLALRQGLALARYEAFTVTANTMPAIVLPNYLSVSQGHQAQNQESTSTWVVVTDSTGQPEGVIGPEAWGTVPADQASQLSLDTMMQVIPRGWAVPAEASGLDALRGLAGPAGQVHYLPVVDGGQVVGVLDLGRVRRVIGLPDGQAKQAGGSES